MKKEELVRVSFDQYLIHFMLLFMAKAGNHVRISDVEIQLKADVNFLFTNAPNRNEIVDEEVWTDLIYGHLERQKYS